MEVTVETTEQDHQDFYKAYGFQRNWIVKVLILALLALILCLCFSVGSGQIILMMVIFSVLLFPFFFVIPYFLSKAKFKRSYENAPSPLANRTYKPFAVGIEVSEDGAETFLRYDHMKSAGKAGRYVYLVLNDGDYHLLPDWCFTSEHEADHFLRIVENGIANERTRLGGFKSPATFKAVYLFGILCLIPLIGAFAGVLFIILGIVHYKDRIMIIIGVLGIVITIAVYGSLFYSVQHSGVFEDGFAEIAQTQVNDLVKSVEFYKLQNGTYPDSLKQLESKNSFLSIYDPLQAFKNSGKSLPYQYQKIGNRYKLFSVGKDGIAGTKDDIYPTLSNPDTSKLGFIRK
ncbi:MAG: type II secretion system protein GspG [Mucilaginibacter sp.]